MTWKNIFTKHGHKYTATVTSTMISHECGYVGLKKSRMLVCVCFEVETAISTVFKLLKIVSSVFSQHSKYIRNVVIASVAHALVIGSFLSAISGSSSSVVLICIRLHCCDNITVIMGIKKSCIMMITSLVVRICHDIKEHWINNYFNSPVWKQFVFKQLLSKHLTMTRQ